MPRHEHDQPATDLVDHGITEILERAPHVGEKMLHAMPGEGAVDGSGHTIRSSLQKGAKRDARAARRLVTLTPRGGGEGVAVGGVGGAQEEVLA